MRAAAVVFAALLLAGCGGGGGDGGGNGGGGGGGGANLQDNSVYQAENGVCASAPPEQLKNDYRTESTDPEDIADRVADTLAGGNPADEGPARQGCLDALKAQG